MGLRVPNTTWKSGEVGRLHGQKSQNGAQLLPLSPLVWIPALMALDLSRVIESSSQARTGKPIVVYLRMGT